MEKGIKSKRKILEVAFNLFSAYSYPDVTYSLLEKATDISRGSMVYYFKNKDGIFKAVVDTFILEMAKIKDIPESERSSLYDFYHAVAANIAKDRDTVKSYGIKNYNEACFNLERNAIQFMPGFKEDRHRVQKEEIEIWKGIIEHGKTTGEVRGDVDPETVATLFVTVRLGQASLGVYTAKGYDQKALLGLYDQLYAIVKN